MSSMAQQLDNLARLQQVTVPDLWQQQAITALREGRDVVVQAPTGAGKTLIFEIWSNQGKNRGQAVYTVPTRALANDKLAEWRARGWDVGIATGDLAENLSAPIVVATLETQKSRLLRGDGPALLVVDEYQMIGDADRGLNYELGLALAPAGTQLLLLSGSVANPQDLVKWLRQLDRDAVLVRSDHRPVPLEEIQANNLSYHLPSEIKGYWPRLIAKALADDLGPVLIFAPRRQAAEAMASELSRYLPNPHPLQLTPEQRLLVGDNLAKMIKSRVAFHHSGLSYAARAGVVEPLAKAGQLRVVVATMGLAAGINFSLRSVVLAGESYRRDNLEQPLKPDEILQMFGRAGRRGLDETGYVLISANEIRLRDGHAGHLSRGGLVDWSAVLGLMSIAAEQGRDPFRAAVEVQERLFTTKPIFLGVEESLKHPSAPCGLSTDAERARHVRKRVREMMNSQGEWEVFPPLQEKPLREIQSFRRSSPGEKGPHPALHSALSEPRALEKVGSGLLCIVDETGPEPVYGRSVTVADLLNDDKVLITKWVRRLINWSNRQAPLSIWAERILPVVEQQFAAQGTRVVRFHTLPHKIVAHISLADQKMLVPVDRHGVPLWRPLERDVLPGDCATCEWTATCRELSAATGVALLWRRLKLVEPSGRPTVRGKIVSFFSQGTGLAIAAALEDETYPLAEMIYDVANLDAGFRFCGDDNRWGGRLALACHEAFGLQSIPGYLENGVPPHYGSGAEQVVAGVHKNPLSKHSWVTDLLGSGDIDRIIIEWRSLLRQIWHAPELPSKRWCDFQKLAQETLHETESPTLASLPPLEYSQTKRVDHKLILRRHDRNVSSAR